MPPSIHFHSTHTIYQRLFVLSSGGGSHAIRNRRFIFAILIVICLLYMLTLANNNINNFDYTSSNAAPQDVDPFQLQQLSDSTVIETIHQLVPKNVDNIRFVRYPLLNPCSTNNSSAGKKSSTTKAIVAYVLSGQFDAHHRLRIRETWGRKLFKLGIPVIFPMAPFWKRSDKVMDRYYPVDHRVLEISLDSEFALFNDILQPEPLVPYPNSDHFPTTNSTAKFEETFTFSFQRSAIDRFERDRTRACPNENRAVLILDRLTKLHPEHLLGFMSAQHVFDHHHHPNSNKIICDSYHFGRYCADTGIIIIPSSSNRNEDGRFLTTVHLIQERVHIRGGHSISFYRLANDLINMGTVVVKSTGSICFSSPPSGSRQTLFAGAAAARKWGQATFCDDLNNNNGANILLSKEFDLH